MTLIQRINMKPGYLKMVETLAKDGEVIKDETSPQQLEVMMSLTCMTAISCGWAEAAISRAREEKAQAVHYHFAHMAYALYQECSELSDAFKKVVVYRQKPDTENLLEEFGDMIFYLCGLTDAPKPNLKAFTSYFDHAITYFNITLVEAQEANMGKLAERYGKALNYSDAAAQVRADKQEEVKTPQPKKAIKKKIYSKKGGSL